MLKARGTRIIGNDAMRREITDREVRAEALRVACANVDISPDMDGQAVAGVMREYGKGLRDGRKAAEAQRIAVAKLDRAKTLKASLKSEVLHTDGHSRMVHKVKTTAQRLMESGKLPRDLKNALDAFSMVVGRALGAAVDDDDDSTSRLTASYDGMPGGAFGSKTLTDKVIDARTELREVGQLVPPELQQVFLQIVAEEVGSLMSKPMSLQQLGEMRGYKSDKQQTASGGTQVYDVIALIAHLARMRGILSRANVDAVRQFVAMNRKSVADQSFSEVTSDNVRGFSA